MISWRDHPKGQGIVVACDEALEWLLPWWWSRYSGHNDLPVVFVDLGMSHFGKDFCQERGELITLPLMASLTSFPSNAAAWEELFGKQVWKRRCAWFKKPFAFLLTPFEKTLWLDIDCEVLRNINSAFNYEPLALVPEPQTAHEKEREVGMIYEDEIIYNSGVVLYEHRCPLIDQWVRATLEAEEEFCSDQHILSRVIYNQKVAPNQLDPIYNWRMTHGINIRAAIVHWVGIWGKAYIRQHGGVAEDILFKMIQ